VAYAGVAGNAALYTQGVPTGRGDVSRETLGGIYRVVLQVWYMG
jgi:hypothetical protein